MKAEEMQIEALKRATRQGNAYEENISAVIHDETTPHLALDMISLSLSLLSLSLSLLKCCAVNWVV